MKIHFLTIAIIVCIFRIEVYGYKSEAHTCGRRLVKHEALIVNGDESKDGDWPWHANILHFDLSQNINYKCGGSLLNPNAILTAAHCVYENGRPLLAERVLTQLGRINLKISGPYSQDLEAYQIFPHHNFNTTSLRHDIAIIRLATKVTFNAYVQPICLWDSNKNSLSEVIGKQGTVVGFGITEANKISYTLQQAVMPVVSLATCLESNSNFYGGFLSDYSFCAGFRNGTTACNGDSGGGLTFKENGIYRIRGIVSLTQVRTGENNHLCKVDEYVVFTDVAKYLSWIEEIAPTQSTETIEYEEPTNEIKYCYFLNNDLTNARIPMDACKNRCSATPRCTHFTWTDYNGGTCWMKQNAVSELDAHISFEKSAVCGIVDNFSKIEWNGNDWAFGCEFHENNLANVKSSNMECHNNCLATVGCTHFSWTDFNGGTCWMKGNAVGKNEAYVSNDKSSICGISTKISWNGNWAFGCDFKGNDFRNVRAVRDECEKLCATNILCTHFAWNTSFGGTCWMKQFKNISKNDATVTLELSAICGLV